MGLLVNVVNVFVDDDGAHGNPLGIVWASSYTRKHEREIAADLGFSETIFIDDLADHIVRARIFTPAMELPFAGHPTVGLAAWLQRAGDEITNINLPAGSVRVRHHEESSFITALPGWCPSFEMTQLDSPSDVDAVDPDAYAYGKNYVWSWLDEAEGRIRARMFAPDLGVREDEATGSAAVRLTSELGRDLHIVQGTGSLIHTHNRYLGQQVEVGGRTSAARTTDLS